MPARRGAQQGPCLRGEVLGEDLAGEVVGPDKIEEGAEDGGVVGVDLRDGADGRGQFAPCRGVDLGEEGLLALQFGHQRRKRIRADVHKHIEVALVWPS